jgi:hypothetical protein
MVKTAATYKEVNGFLRSKGLAPIPIPEGSTQDSPVNIPAGSAVASGVADSLGQIQPNNKKKKAPSQPKWKWSWDPTDGLLIWSVDSKYGQPHHIEVTGPQFYQMAQGRIYVDWDGHTEILVWSDRASEEWQDMAVEDVDNWLIAHTGKPADEVYYQSEGGFYQSINPKQTPAQDKMIQTYFQVNKNSMPPKKWLDYIRSYNDILNTYDPNAPKPGAIVTPADYRGEPTSEDLGEPDANYCPDCNGHGTTENGLVCPTCGGTGYAN